MVLAHMSWNEEEKIFTSFLQEQIEDSWKALFGKLSLILQSRKESWKTTEIRKQWIKNKKEAKGGQTCR